MCFCTHGSLSFPYILATKSSLVYFLCLSGASFSCTSGGSFFSLSLSGSTPSSVSASEVDILLGSTIGSSSIMGSFELSASLCFFFFFFLFLQLRILFDSLWMPLWIERVLSVCPPSGLNTVGLYVLLFGIVSKQIYLHIRKKIQVEFEPYENA